MFISVEEDEEADEEEAEGPDLDDFQTLELTLEEARRRYDNEESRRDAVESKIGTVVTVDALIISFGGLFSSLNPMLILFILFPAVVSAGFGLYGIRSQIYGKPGYDIDDFHDYSEMEKAEQQEHFLLAYEVTTQKNAELNTTKFSIFNYCSGYTITSLALALVAPLLSQIGALNWISALSLPYTVLLIAIILLAIMLLPPLVIYSTLETDRED